MKELSLPEAISILDQVSIYGNIFSPHDHLIVQDGWFIQESGKKYLRGHTSDELLEIIKKNSGNFRVYSSRHRKLSGDYSIKNYRKSTKKVY
ncbi:MAG: hypothetical protein VX712_03255 [Bacteroidota bacterium]|uniref:Uncharacterized protein n=1 Tax=Christiangramia flava JLT2011 TaxID=1229726 RepID=A0A1L7HZJ1_9FLAO|nr:hypothetical protein [Christiangramia flava]APU66761.1 hypothetical protein GRFL_0037 [Christiangramia flava JLT2011]MEE2771208.1 hypothetical protein [Bacteroidota bacterium]OSS38398.1 hypothetical protein C723_2635 [Christiangramia flava JLT2011]